MIYSENNGIVYLAINDILNHYDTKKKAQNAVKSAKHGVSSKKLAALVLISHICNMTPKHNSEYLSWKV